MKNNKKSVSLSMKSEITKLSLATLSNIRWLRKGLPYIKIGRSVRYMKSDVLAYSGPTQGRNKTP